MLCYKLKLRQTKKNSCKHQVIYIYLSNSLNAIVSECSLQYGCMIPCFLASYQNYVLHRQIWGEANGGLALLVSYFTLPPFLDLWNTISRLEIIQCVYQKKDIHVQQKIKFIYALYRTLSEETGSRFLCQGLNTLIEQSLFYRTIISINSVC